MSKILRAIAIIACCPGITALADDLDQGWSDVHLDQSFLDYYIGSDHRPNQYPCYDSAENLYGCLRMINGLGEKLRPAQVFMNGKIRVNSDYTPTHTVADYGAISLVDANEVTAEDGSAVEKAVRTKHYEAALRAAAKRLFAKSGRIDFQSLASAMISRLPSSVIPQKAIADAVLQLLFVHDRHAHFNVAAFLDSQKTNADRAVSGIGTQLTVENKSVVVEDTVSGTPAESAGILRGDVIVSVNGQATAGIGIDKVRELIHGEKGTAVTLEIRRNNIPLPPLELKREEYIDYNVTSSIVSDLGQKFLYVRLKHFVDQAACDKIRNVIEAAPTTASGIILDLRDNLGGFVSQAVCIGGLFVGPKTIALTSELENGKEKEPLTSDANQTTRLPVALLINHGSASASEILGGAMQDEERAWLVGTRSFGKATIQSPRKTEPEPGIKLFTTTSRLYTPKGRSSQIVGLKPDFEVYSEPNPKPKEVLALREEDLSPPALPHDGGFWHPSHDRQSKIAKIKHACLTRQHRALNLYAQSLASNGRPDSQLYTAEEILSCDP